MTSNTKPFDW